jgi:hypothetical protein
MSKGLERKLEHYSHGRVDSFNAVGIAEGFIEADSEEQIIEAWQYLIDSGLAWKLQGWFGRTANQLIEEGYCSAPSASTETHLGAIPTNFYFCV